MSFETQLKTNYASAHARLLNPEIKPNPVPVTPQRPNKGWPQQRKFFQLSTVILPQSPKLHTILRLASEMEGVEINAIVGVRKQSHIVLARQLYFFFAYYYTRCSLEQIGRVVGGKDHTTVLHGVRKMERLFNSDELWRGKFQDMLVQLKILFPAIHREEDSL